MILCFATKNVSTAIDVYWFDAIFNKNFIFVLDEVAGLDPPCDVLCYFYQSNKYEIIELSLLIVMEILHILLI
jgi:hypothetical protein